MDKKKKQLILSAVILAAALALGAGWFVAQHTFVNGKAYRKDSAALDLRGQNVTAEHFEAVQAAFPECVILWDVPLQSGDQSSDSRQLTVSVLTESDVAAMAYFPNLETLDARGCTDYDQITALKAQYPDVEVLYTVTIDGTAYPQDAVSVTVGTLTEADAALLSYLPNLRQVDAANCTDYAQLAALAENHPEYQVQYSVPVAGEEISGDTTSLTLTGASGEELLEKLAYLPRLEQAELIDPEWSGDQMRALLEAYPQVDFSWEMDLMGFRITSDDTEVDLSGIQLTTLDVLEETLDCFPNVEKVFLDQCGIDNETLAAFREEKRAEYKVAWTVITGHITVRTDATTYMPNEHGLIDEWAYNLRYCEDMICVDVGHKPIYSCEWVRFMPNLKYLILACTLIEDISPLAELDNLIYLELFKSHVRDYTPLLECTSLQDLNISCTYGDPEVVAQMTWLKRLWWVNVGAPVEMLQEALPDTQMVLRGLNSTGYGWRQGTLYYEMRDLLGMYYMWD